MNLYQQEYVKQLKKEEAQLKLLELEEIKREEYLDFEITGNRLIVERKYFQRRRFLLVYGLLAVVSNNNFIHSTLEAILISICKEVSWAIPAHVQKQKEGWENTLDLFSCETAQALSHLYCLLEDVLSKSTKELVCKEIYKRVLHPFYQSKQDDFWWETDSTNWCAVCCGAIGSTIINMEKNKDIKRKYTKRINQSIQHYLLGFNEDGVCLEGIDYFFYGMSYYVGYASQCKELTNGEIDLLNDEKVKVMTKFFTSCFLKDGNTVSFSDASIRGKYRVGLSGFLLHGYNLDYFSANAEAENCSSDPCYRWLCAWQDYQWGSLLYENTPQIEQKNIGKNEWFYPNSQWYICNGSKMISFAVKGGCNDEPHNHNDVGNFLLSSLGEMLLVDIGAGEYVKEYFTDQREQFFVVSSFSHNVPIINELGQGFGSEFKAAEFIKQDHKIRISYAEAYKETRPKKMIREIYLIEDEDILVIEDGFFFEDKDSEKIGSNIVKENLVTLYPPKILKDGFSITTKQQQCRIMVINGEDFQIIERDYHDHKGETQKAYCMLCRAISGKVMIKIMLRRNDD